MGLIHKQTNNCDFSKRGSSPPSVSFGSHQHAVLDRVSSATFFSSGCAPGAEPSSPFCAACAGSGKTVGDEFKCKASPEEHYYGYAGAFRWAAAVTRAKRSLSNDTLQYCSRAKILRFIVRLACLISDRCLVEGAGDVAFIKHSIVMENSDGETLVVFSSSAKFSSLLGIKISSPPPCCSRQGSQLGEQREIRRLRADLSKQESRPRH